MKRLLSGALVGALLLATSAGDEPGTPYCFGTDCPCGNDDADAGCSNSTGSGTVMSGLGSTSISADDLNFVGVGLPLNSVTLVLIGSGTNDVFLGDGKLCVGGKVGRLFKHLNSGSTGAVRFKNVISGFLSSNKVINPGDTFYFQLWHRDAPKHQAPCGSGSNTSNAYQVTFTP